MEKNEKWSKREENIWCGSIHEIRCKFNVHANSGYTRLNLFGERAVADMRKELKQLEEVTMPVKEVVTAIDPDILSAEDKAKALNAMNLVN